MNDKSAWLCGIGVALISLTVVAMGFLVQWSDRRVYDAFAGWCSDRGGIVVTRPYPVSMADSLACVQEAR